MDASISPSMVAFRWEAHDRHSPTTGIVVIGIPLLTLLAVVMGWKFREGKWTSIQI